MNTIPVEDLDALAFYIGEGRCIGGIAMWTGWSFAGVGVSFGIYDVVHMEYGDRGFSPHTKILKERPCSD